MTKLGVVESTLFVPMTGRIYASENFPGILYDEQALALKDQLPGDTAKKDRQTQYTFLASASRSANMDRFVRDFLRRKPEGGIVQLGCGLETAFYRNSNGRTRWYEVDLPDVIAFRKTLLPEQERDVLIAADAFTDTWIRQVREQAGNVPLLVMAGGLFYYFEEEKVLSLMKLLQAYGDIEIVFDAVNKGGMAMMRRKWMKQVGHEDARMFFYVDSAAALAEKIGGRAQVLAEEKYYEHIDKKGIGLPARINMAASDAFRMVKMIHLKL
jgi:O-methyltransferase involved in polyketide biosynthesis